MVMTMMTTTSRLMRITTCCNDDHNYQDNMMGMRSLRQQLAVANQQVDNYNESEKVEVTLQVC